MAVSATEKAADYGLEVSVTGINGNYDEFIKKFCTVPDNIMLDPKYSEGGFSDPAVGVEVVLKNVSGEPVQTQKTDSEGKCRFQGLPLAKYYAEVVSLRPSSLTGATERILYRVANIGMHGEYQRAVSIAGQYFVAEIRGRIVDAVGKGVKDVPVNLVVNEEFSPSFDWRPIECRATTDDFGNYRIPASVYEADLFDLSYFFKMAIARKKETVSDFDNLYHVEAGDGITYKGIGNPFFILTEEMHHYGFVIINTLPENSGWFRYHGMKKTSFDIKRKFSSVPKSKGHVLFLPDIVLEKVQETTAE